MMEKYKIVNDAKPNSHTPQYEAQVNKSTYIIKQIRLGDFDTVAVESGARSV